MGPDGLFALRTGVFRLPDGQPATLETHVLGTLCVRSGKLALCDPLYLQDPGLLTIPPGDYKVVATIARVPESYALAMSRPAYLSLMLSGEPTASIRPAVFATGGSERGVRPVEGVAVMPGLQGIPSSQMSSVAMVDAEAIVRAMPDDPGTWFDSVISPSDGTGWFDRMDTEIDGPLGSLFTRLPKAADAENIAILIARPGRVFPVLETRDAQDRITGIHIDLLVIGDLSEVLQAFDGQDDYALEYAEEVARDLRHQQSQRAEGLIMRMRKFFKR